MRVYNGLGGGKAAPEAAGKVVDTSVHSVRVLLVHTHTHVCEAV